MAPRHAVLPSVSNQSSQHSLQAGRLIARTLHPYTWAAGAVMVASLAAPLPADAEPERPRIQVWSQNDARVPSELLNLAQDNVSEIYAAAGITVVWLSEKPAAPEAFRTVVILPGEIPGNRKGSALWTLGRAPVQTEDHRVRAYVSYSGVKRVALKHTACLYRILAAVMAHELGHLLLPDGWHADGGLMKACWNAGEIDLASRGTLVFTPVTTGLLRAGTKRP